MSRVDSSKSIVYLIPVPLHEGETQTIPPYVLQAIKDCQCFFVENERSARRALKLLWKEMVIDDYLWVNVKDDEQTVKKEFRRMLGENKNIGIMSEAGCPGIADPGQALVDVAHHAGATVKPLVGASSILLALMASGLNGQRFRFNGYLPINANERATAIRQSESESAKKNCTQVFIETPYRNNQLLETMVNTLQPSTSICIAADLTSAEEFIKTKTAGEW